MVVFCTHLHTDHTAGYPDLIFTPWVLERPVPLKVFGPKGMQHMTDHILKAYETDIDFRINGFEKANESGYRVEVTEIESGIIYKDDRVTVEAFPVSHGTEKIINTSSNNDCGKFSFFSSFITFLPFCQILYCQQNNYILYKS